MNLKLDYKYDFFISYSRNIYIKFVKDFVTSLQKYELNIWLDKKDVYLGDNIIVNLFNTLDLFKAKTFGIIIILDKSYFKKAWCLKELDYVIENKISFFPILFHMEKKDIPSQYQTLNDYNMVTIRNIDDDKKLAINKILDIYIKKEIRKNIIIKTDIFSYLVNCYWYADKTNQSIIINADNIALYIKAWFNNQNYLLDMQTKIMINIIHYQLLDYYNGAKVTDFEIKIICHAVENLIKGYGDFRFINL